MSSGTKFAIAVAAIALVGGGVIVGYLIRGPGSAPAAPKGERAFAEVVGPVAARLAERFRPWLRFDSGERWLPVSVASLVSEHRDGKPAQEFCTRSQAGVSCEPIDGMKDFEGFVSESSALGASTFVKIAGHRLDEYRAPERPAACVKTGLLDCGEAPSSAIYYRVTESNERFYVDYWWFLRYNHVPVVDKTCFVETELCDEHQGDWEGVTLVTLPKDRQHLDYAVYAAHKGRFRYPAEQLRMHDGRPVVFVARGTHASYPRPCSSQVCPQPIALVGSIPRPDTSADGGRPWPRNGKDCEPETEGSCLRPLPSPQPGESVWTTWPGLWGGTCGKVCGSDGPQSPESPGLQPRFRGPWCSTTTAGAEVCDSAPPGCSDWMGPLVAAIVCDPKRLSKGLVEPEASSGGGLRLTVTSASGETRHLSAVTTGIVQALGPPLRPHSVVTATGVGSGTELMIRARKGMRVIEARYDPYPAGTAGGSFEIKVEGRHGVPVLVAEREDGVAVKAEEDRRLFLPVPPGTSRQ